MVSSSAPTKGSSAFVAIEQTARQKLDKERVLRLLLGLDVLKDIDLCQISLVLY